MSHKKTSITRIIICLGIAIALSSAAFAKTENGASVSKTDKTSNSAAYQGHGIALHGDLKYGSTFPHFEYADPNALKGGTAAFSVIGTFDNVNPHIMKGVTAAGANSLFSSLTVASRDEPFSHYCYVCKTIEVSADRTWVAYTLRPEARFNNGQPVTPEDIIFSFTVLKTKGHPFYRMYYKDVMRAEKTGPHGVKFIFRSNTNKELPLIIGELPILSRTYWKNRDFEKTTLEPPVGSGPYEISAIDPGRSITYTRVQNWWGAKLPVNVGRYNFDSIRYMYYRDSTIALEAFKAGEYDIRFESSSKLWATGYDSPALKDGRIKKDEIQNQSPVGMQGFFFNTRRSVFQNRLVREALGYAFDFEWINQALMYGAYARTRSFFERSELAAHALPSGEELRILEEFRKRIPDEVFTKEYAPPATDGSGNIRDNLRTAVKLLRSAGWTVDAKTKKLTRRGLNGPEQMKFEILLDSPLFERVVLPFIANLEKLGITVRVRTVDDSQYMNRLRSFDYDVIIATVGGMLSPGNEQRSYWSSKSADTTGELNYAGVKDPVVDELVERTISAPDRASLVATTKALDRVLLWGHYVIPQWHTTATRTAYWNKFSRPAREPKYGIDIYTWWIVPERARSLIR